MLLVLGALGGEALTGLGNSCRQCLGGSGTDGAVIGTSDASTFGRERLRLVGQ